MSIRDRLNGHTVHVHVAIVATLIGAVLTFTFTWVTKLHSIDVSLAEVKSAQTEHVNHTTEDHKRIDDVAKEVKASIKDLTNKVDELKHDVDTKLPRQR